eukprot:CAMPEP_0197421406 /NCGR_PEP_ID=MMETSP1170-20131217/6715_1 /TAXON_ID=54406 /ORGANISM="Sarcinochrysis sp, Strain CCMP770" /LENGTH=223 /DNA_ID=CAMNT_0042948637 /DNA_START=60 /DNA_END=731 /DNA_ORIENTATION=-
MAARKVCTVIGYGPGIGHAAAAKFAKEGYSVAIVGRTASKLEAGAASIPNCRSYVADVTDSGALTQALGSIESDLGAIDAVVYNAGSGTFKTYDKISMPDIDKAIGTNLKGLFTCAQVVCPKMEARGSGFVVVTGATASLRGKPFTASFAAGKAAQRSFTQSLARQLGPKNVHVCYAIIDGGVGKSAGSIDPDAIASAYYYLSTQDPSCWTFELDVRPSVENW